MFLDLPKFHLQRYRWIHRKRATPGSILGHQAKPWNSLNGTGQYEECRSHSASRIDEKKLLSGRRVFLSSASPGGPAGRGYGPVETPLRGSRRAALPRRAVLATAGGALAMAAMPARPRA